MRSVKAEVCLHEALLPVAKVFQGWGKVRSQVLEQTGSCAAEQKAVLSLTAGWLRAAGRFSAAAVRLSSVSSHGA